MPEIFLIRSTYVVLNVNYVVELKSPRDRWNLDSRQTQSDEIIRRTLNGTFSVFPLMTIPSYRIALETSRATITHIVIEEKLTQVLPNYEAGQ